MEEVDREKREPKPALPSLSLEDTQRLIQEWRGNLGGLRLCGDFYPKGSEERSTLAALIRHTRRGIKAMEEKEE